MWLTFALPFFLSCIYSPNDSMVTPSLTLSSLCKLLFYINVSTAQNPKVMVLLETFERLSGRRLGAKEVRRILVHKWVWDGWVIEVKENLNVGLLVPLHEAKKQRKKMISASTPRGVWFGRQFFFLLQG